MKVWMIVVAISLVGIFFLGIFLPQSEALALDKGRQPIDSAERGGSFALLETEKAEEVRSIDNSEKESVLSSFSGDGRYTRAFINDGALDVQELMESMGFHSREEVMSFLSESPLISLRSPLDAEGLGTLFYLIVALAEGSIPIDCKMESITFLKRGEELLVHAEVFLSFGRFREEYGFEFLPEKAGLSITIPFYLKSADISVFYEGIKVCFGDSEIPEVILSAGCSAVMGKKVDTVFLADLVANVIRNACFSG